MAWSSERGASGGGRLLSRALSLPPGRRRHLAVAVLELLRARLRFAALTPRDCLAELRRRALEGREGASAVPEGPARETLEAVAWAIPAAARHVPWRADCLVQALAADRWLRRRGLAPAFFLGVTKGGQGELLAHAWVRCGDVTVTGAGHEDFSVLVGPAGGT